MVEDDGYDALADSWGSPPAMQWTWLSPYWVAKLKELGFTVYAQVTFFGSDEIHVALPFSNN